MDSLSRAFDIPDREFLLSGVFAGLALSGWQLTAPGNERPSFACGQPTLYV